MLIKQLALNAEMAYKRNNSHATIDGNVRNDWNASSFGFIVGLKMFFQLWIDVARQRISLLRHE
jgi:hypothetical protein